MKLNLAHGTHPSADPEWLNFDLPWEGVIGADVYGDAFVLPFRDGAFTAAYVGHFLEHIPWDLLPVVLAELRRVLRAEAEVAFVGPCIDKAVATGQPDWLLRAIDVLSDGPGGHKWVATEALTVDAVRAVFPNARAVPVADVDAPEWPNPTTAPWQCAVRAAA